MDSNPADPERQKIEPPKAHRIRLIALSKQTRSRFEKLQQSSQVGLLPIVHRFLVSGARRRAKGSADGAAGAAAAAAAAAHRRSDGVVWI